MALCHTVVVEASTTESSKFAPEGFVYQAESPDESALVNGASQFFGYQLISSSSKGIVISVTGSSVLPPPSEFQENADVDKSVYFSTLPSKPVKAKFETWQILAINKFDSDRKRMSVVVRSPDSLGGVPFLLCKGADSSMLCPGVCIGGEGLGTMEDRLTIDLDGLGCPMKHFENLLQLQQDLAELAKDGLRTLVLGVRALSESELSLWMAQFKAAEADVGSSRASLLTQAAVDIESKLYIVGATGIEDKLQDGVPQCIDSLAAAGMKLWVLTGDKRETAIEIGYATLLLKPDMELTIFDGDVQDKETVRENMAKEFIRQIKLGKLPKYSKKYVLSEKVPCKLKLLNCLRSMFHQEPLLTDNKKKLKVRHYANWLVRKEGDPQSPPSQANIFEKAKLARRFSRRLTMRNRQGASGLGPKSASSSFGFTSEDDMESVVSLAAEGQAIKASRFERLFSVDKYVRHGRLRKHISRKRQLAAENDIKSESDSSPIRPSNSSDPDLLRQRGGGHNRERSFTGVTNEPTMKTDVSSPFGEADGALVITGSALKHLLGDPKMEEILFNVATCSKSIIACRVSPKQKALLVKLVKRYVKPRPVTLAIGDGANDVGMIQEAQIGIGISGLEGQQAVNNSDFAIAQFRFLSHLLLKHGRWNYVRMSKVCMYSFYKNSVLVFTIFFFQIYCHWTGRPLYDEWVTGMFNFVLAVPILIVGIFDRDITSKFALENPETYIVGRMNQDMSKRVIYRWASLAVLHSTIIYFFSQIVYGTGTSGYQAANAPYINSFANGEGANLATYGTTIYNTMIIALTLKVMIETRSYINGQCYGGFYDRLPYTWLGIVVFSLGLWAFFLGIYQLLFFKSMPHVPGFFVWVSQHTFVYRPWIYLFAIVVPTACILVDIIVKTVAFWYFPSQTQIYGEISKIQTQRDIKEGKIADRRPSKEEGTGCCCGFATWVKVSKESRDSFYDDSDSIAAASPVPGLPRHSIVKAAEVDDALEAGAVYRGDSRGDVEFATSAGLSSSASQNEIF